MAGRLLVLFAAGLALGGAAAAPSAHDLAGRWTHRFTSGDVSGARFPVEDEVIIVGIDRAHALVDIQLNFFNGHECSIGGMATLEGRQLVYRDPSSHGYDERTCVLRIWRDGARLRWDDAEGTCQGFCGARGGLSGGDMRWAARRAIPPSEQARIIAGGRSLP